MRRCVTHLVLSWCLAAVMCPGCSKSSPQHVAKLVQLDHIVQQQRGSAAWDEAVVGDEYHLGDAVRTGAEATAELSLARGGMLRMDPDTVIRFQGAPGESVDLDVEAGAIEVEAGDQEVVFDTSIGRARIEAGGSLRVRAEPGGGMRVEVLVGRAVIEPDDGPPMELGDGEGMSVDIEGAILEDEGMVAASEHDAGVIATPPPPKGDVKVVVTGSGATIETEKGWEALAPGEHDVADGAKLKVARKTSVELTRGGQRAVVRGAAVLVVGGPDGALVEAASGSVTVYAAERDTVVAVPGGVIVARGRQGGSTADVTVGAKGKPSDVTTKRGETEVRTESGDEVLAVGESAKVSATGKVEVAQRVPKRADIAIKAGESPVVHDSGAPTAIRIDFSGACSGEAIVESSPRSSFGKGVSRSAGRDGANLLFAAGTHYYRVRCATNDGFDATPKLSGSIRVTRDSGKKAFPSKPPATVIDADGRRYTVLYQNHLPAITFRWPDAPGSSGFEFHLEKKSGKTTVETTAKPKHTRSAGHCTEGEYTWWFTDKNGRESPKTKLVVDFDNTAATAYLEKVTAGANGRVHVEGAVLDGWSVAVAGRSISLDRHNRFSADVSPEGNSTAATVRISHSSRGVQYYVLRVVTG